MYKIPNDITENNIIIRPMQDSALPFTQKIVHYPAEVRKDEHSNQRLHFHDAIEIHYILEGHGRSVVDNKTYQTEPGDILFIPSNVFHINEITEEDVVSYRLTVDDSYLRDMKIYLEQTPIQTYIKDETARSIYHEMYLEASAKKQEKYSDVFCLANLLRLIVYLTRNFYDKTAEILPSKTKNNKLEMARKAIKYMEENFQRQISFCEMAKSLGYSQYYFSHVFKEVVGCTAVHFLNIIRCNYATVLMSETNYNINEIAEKCGYMTPSYFSQTYKKIMGKNPSDNKSSLKKEHA